MIETLLEKLTVREKEELLFWLNQVKINIKTNETNFDYIKTYYTTVDLINETKNSILSRP